MKQKITFLLAGMLTMGSLVSLSSCSPSDNTEDAATLSEGALTTEDFASGKYELLAYLSSPVRIVPTTYIEDLMGGDTVATEGFIVVEGADEPIPVQFVYTVESSTNGVPLIGIVEASFVDAETSPYNADLREAFGGLEFSRITEISMRFNFGAGTVDSTIGGKIIREYPLVPDSEQVDAEVTQFGMPYYLNKAGSF